MKFSAIAAAVSVVLASVSFAAPAESADARRFLRFAGSTGAGGVGLAMQPRFVLPRRPIRPVLPRFGGTQLGKCHGQRCVDGGKITGIATTCPSGMTRRAGKGCSKIVTVAPCPNGTYRLRGNCVPFVKPTGGDNTVTVDPGRACQNGHKRRGKRCVVVVPPDPPRLVIPADKSTPEIDDSGANGKSPKAAKPVPSAPPAIHILVGDRPHRPRELVVLVATDGAADVVAELTRRHRLVAEERHAIALAGGTLVRFGLADNRPLEDVLAAVARDPRVLLAQPNFTFATSDAGVAPARLLQYAPGKIRVADAHALARGAGVRLAILDTGIDTNHPEIAGIVAATFDALNDGRVAAEAHGTAIAGIIGSRSRLQGVAPEVSILSVRAFAGGGAGAATSTTMALAKGIDWAFAQKARLFNLSFAGPDDPLLARVIDTAARQGSIFIAAAGNGGPQAAPAYPGAYGNVIAVTATDDSDRLFARAALGPHVAIAAPGVDILAAAPGGGYDVSSGTSLAAAHVSGVVALMLQRQPSLTLTQIREVLAQTASKLDTTAPGRTGAGLIDAAAATQAAAKQGLLEQVAAD